VDVQGIIDHAYGLIAPYVEKDPTKFCTTEEFETGVETLREFCALRSQSVSNQLSGSNETVDASHLDTSAMGSMGGDRMPGREQSGKQPEEQENAVAGQPQTDAQTSATPQNFDPSAMQGGFDPNNMPGGMSDFDPSAMEGFDPNAMPGGMQMPGAMPDATTSATPEAEESPATEQESTTGSKRPQQSFDRGNSGSFGGSMSAGSVMSNVLPLALSVVVMAAALIFAFAYKRKC